MNKHRKLAVESLLKQMPLTEPPESLDQKIRRIADEHPQRVAPAVAGRFGWIALVSTAVAATLFGVVVGIVGVLASKGIEGIPSISGPANTAAENSNSIASKRLHEVTLFQAMHGHSSQEEFKTCSNCHRFDSKERQILDKWKHGPDLTDEHQVLGQKCTLCHAGEAVSSTESREKKTKNVENAG